MGHNINGLYHYAANKQQKRCVMCNNRSPYENGTLRCLPWHHEPRRPSRPLPPTDNQTPRTAKQYYIRQRVRVYLRLLEMSNGSTQDITQPQYSLPPANGWTNGKGQCHPGAVSPGILQLSTGQLGLPTANCRILLQHTQTGSTKITAFFANYGYHQRFLPDLGTRKNETAEVSEYVEALWKLHKDLRPDIKEAQMAQTEQAIKARHPDPVLNSGDEVWLRRKHIQTTRPSNKL